MSLQTVKLLFWAAGLYDLGLGLIFCFFFKPLYAWMNLILPNHDGYLQFSALCIALFGLGFLMVARDPLRNRPIIQLGILFKLIYIFVTLYHYFTTVMAKVFLAFTVFDVVFCLLFFFAYAFLDRLEPEKTSAR